MPEDKPTLANKIGVSQQLLAITPDQVELGLLDGRKTNGVRHRHLLVDHRGMLPGIAFPVTDFDL